ncbi:NUDIX domain-containing protein [Paenibacillus spongiae]|uniref:NUDIX domain-containing protein n=1 Tax=Paenibacillus spongiae TaxID=2909671 RepID=A0ABY5SKP6_9BACL|nr:NUDIX domain-containing protein [Paenibacillus spongiae]UVI33090.1 NUDIX domain-containing protein [Paenibacillus spongiae]
MGKPLLRAEGIIVDDRNMKVLVQCDAEESFYRFPGGAVEFRETAAHAIIRELMEEFDLPVEVGRLAVVNESIVEYDGIQRHDCTLLHWCSLIDEWEDTDAIWHSEHPDIKLVWRTFEQLESRPVYPEGIVDTISKVRPNTIDHLVTIITY